MRSKKSIETITLEDGTYHEKVFKTYIDMAKHAVDWTLFCTYQLKPNAINGVYKILSLPSIQIAYTEASGGIMYDYVAPEDCISISVMKYIENKACLDQMKLKTDMVAIIDDQKIYNFMHNAKVHIFDISIKKSAYPVLVNKLSKNIDKYYIDNDKKLSHFLDDILNTFKNTIPVTTITSDSIEKDIIKHILALCEHQEAQATCFTKSESTVITIKNKIFKHIDGNPSISKLSKEHGISERSLQNGFKSLYDIRPKEVMRLLKLNLIHNELLQSTKENKKVHEIAQKWGFMHMGRFSEFYTQLFLENPSHTLRKTPPKNNAIHKNCVERREEMERIPPLSILKKMSTVK